MTETECECKTWAEQFPRDALLGNGHNTACKKFDSGFGAVILLKQLVEGIEWWASQEDGVPEELWEAYSRAHFIARGTFPQEKRP